MSRYGWCWNDREHEDQARRDARYDRPDREMYDRYTTDPCKEVYTETYDRERRAIEYRQEQEREERRTEEYASRRRHEREAEEADYLAQMERDYYEQAERAYYEQQQREQANPPEPDSATGKAAP